MPLLAIFPWSLYSMPPGLSASDIATDTQPNDPAAPGYNSGVPSWIGQDYSFNGGSSTQIDITDDDGNFEDGYVETGTAQTLTSAVTIDGTTYPAGSVVENEFSMVDASGNEVFVVRINGENVGFAYPDGQAPTTGSTFTSASGRDGDPADNAPGQPSSSEPYTGIICFLAGTHIATPDGPRPVETLAPGMLVLTVDHGPQPVRWTGQRELAFSHRGHPDQPILFTPGSLGPDTPARPLAVSPQHRILLRGPEVAAHFGQEEVLAPARGLTGLPGVRQMLGKRKATYLHILLDCHAILTAEGARTESFYPGPAALAMLTQNQRNAVLDALGPRIGDYSPLARMSVTVGAARDFVATRTALSSAA